MLAGPHECTVLKLHAVTAHATGIFRLEQEFVARKLASSGGEADPLCAKRMDPCGCSGPVSNADQSGAVGAKRCRELFRFSRGRTGGGAEQHDADDLCQRLGCGEAVGAGSGNDYETFKGNAESVHCFKPQLREANSRAPGACG